MKRPLIKAFPTRARIDLLVPPYIRMNTGPARTPQGGPRDGRRIDPRYLRRAEELAEVAIAYCESRIAASQNAQAHTVICE